MVTNAIRYAPGSFQVAVEDRHEPLIEVRDSSPDPPRMLRPGAGGEGGRGLHLLDTLSRRWGWRRVQGGKVVWFCLTRGPA